MQSSSLANVVANFFGIDTWFSGVSSGPKCLTRWRLRKLLDYILGAVGIVIFEGDFLVRGVVLSVSPF